MYRKADKGINRTFLRLRLLVLVALTTGMRMGEIFNLKWSGVLYGEGLLAVTAKLKGGKVRYVPMPPGLAEEFRTYPRTIGEALVSSEERRESGKAGGRVELRDDSPTG